MLPVSKLARGFALQTVYAVAVLVLLAPLAHADVPQAAHRAFYSIALGRTTGAATIVAVKGAMTAEWERGCDGWTGNQKLAVTMERQEGSAVVSEVSASIFESHDGTRLRFTSRTAIDDEVIEQVRGQAQRPSGTAPGTAVYMEPAGVKVELPADTLFPFQHTLAMIDAAKSGVGRDFSLFFDGSQPDKAPLYVNTLVIGGAHAAGDGPGSGFGPLTAHRWWPVRLAFFGREDSGGEPEMEMSQHVQENGVVRLYTFDYGDFDIVATLQRIEPIDVPACK